MDAQQTMLDLLKEALDGIKDLGSKLSTVVTQVGVANERIQALTISVKSHDETMYGPDGLVPQLEVVKEQRKTDRKDIENLWRVVYFVVASVAGIIIARFMGLL